MFAATPEADHGRCSRVPEGIENCLKLGIEIILNYTEFYAYQFCKKPLHQP